MSESFLGVSPSKPSCNHLHALANLFSTCSEFCFSQESHIRKKCSFFGRTGNFCYPLRYYGESSRIDTAFGSYLRLIYVFCDVSISMCDSDSMFSLESKNRRVDVFFKNKPKISLKLECGVGIEYPKHTFAGNFA